MSFDKTYYENKLKAVAEKARKKQIDFINDSLKLSSRFAQEDRELALEAQEIQKALKDNEPKLLDKDGKALKKKETKK